ncbi:MAG: hypothetical protein SVK08_01970 [Halobacteriota archaeon]|nr:hypothetical protein [Halobacteriota archaeon]
MTKTELSIIVQKRLRQISDYIVPEDVTEAIEDAERETGWTLPVSGSFKEFWMINRSKRHVYEILRTGNAHKFKVEGINLQHRFDHYDKLIREMDEKFEAAVKDNPADFAGVDVFKMFGMKVDAGFSYNEHGKDITYDPDQLIEFSPKETD